MGAKLMTNKERANQTKKIYYQINRQKDGWTEKYNDAI